MPHTPGPWQWERERHQLTSPAGVVLEFWARYADDDGVDVAEEDACLIEASPELLAATKWALSFITDDNECLACELNDDRKHEDGCITLSLRDAIAKAMR